ncbi:hypothetical protein RMCBS344292_16398 [Rhizopus microsporus]|nr:hypothetical protein RMCBS344292_16398 [Rhizopus microsporus]
MDNARLRELLLLLEKRNQQREDVDLETKFFNDILEYFLSPNVNHWWCTEATLPLASESLWLFSLPDHDPIVQYKNKLNQQLKSCGYCARTYQTSKVMVRKRYETLFPRQTVDQFFNILSQFDLSRINSTLREYNHNPTMTDETISALLEIISSPTLLGNVECDDLFCSMFDQIQKTGLFPTLEASTAASVSRLTLHHHRVVRFWARKLFEKIAVTGQHTFLEEDLLQIKDLIIYILQLLAGTHQRLVECPFKATQDMGEFWKALRLVVVSVDSDILKQSLTDSEASMLTLIRTQLSTSSEWLVELLKTMTAMLLKLQSQFWGHIQEDSTPYYNIIKQICEHHVFQTVMKIAREGNTGKILQKDGTQYPEDKLMAKIKSILEWMYPYWSSLRGSPVEREITERILDTTFGYFQMDTWGVMSRAYCAELGLQIIDQCLSDDTVPAKKIEEYIPKVMTFVKTDPSTLPLVVQHMPKAATNLLGDLVDRYTVSVMNVFQHVFPSEEDFIVEPMAKDSYYQAIWNSVVNSFQKEPFSSQSFFSIFLKAYANVASADIHDLAKQTSNSALPDEVLPLAEKLHIIRSHVLQVLHHMPSLDWETRKSMITEGDLVKPLLHLWCSQYPEFQNWVILFIQPHPHMINADIFDAFFNLQPSKVIEAFNWIIQEYNSLFHSKLDVFRSIPSFIQVLKFHVSTLTNKYIQTLLASNNGAAEESGQISLLWDICWKTCHYVFQSGLKWAESYKPREVVDTILPVLDIATNLLHSRQAFERLTSSDIISYNFMSAAASSLSHWVYVTRQDVINLLVPLLINMLDVLKKAELKISVEAYDRLMAAATGVSTSKLQPVEKEKLFMALSAHEPNNFIFLNDSDEEEVEWQPINTPNRISSSPVRETTPVKKKQMTLAQSFANATIGSPQRDQVQEKGKDISSFGGDSETPHVVSDDEFEKEYGDIDLTQIDDEWFAPVKEERHDPMDVDLTPASTAAPPSSSETKRQAVPIDVPRTNISSVKRQAVSIDVPKRDSGVSRQAVSIDVPKRYQPRVYVPETTQQQTYAVTFTGRKLKPPPMGFSKLKSLREEFRAQQRLMATVKSPSASGVINRDDELDNSSSESSDDEGKGLLGLVNDMDNRSANIKAESASVKALFDTKPKPYIHVPTTFKSFKEYKTAFEPLLVMETWSQIQRAKESLSQSDVMERCLVVSRCHTNDFVDITFAMPMSLVTNNISIDDLVCIANHFGSAFFNDPTSLTEGTEAMKPWRGRAFLGKVISINQTKNMGEVGIRCYFTSDRISVLNSVSPKTSWSILRIMSLTTAMREYAALEGLEHFELGPEILCPTPNTDEKPSASTIQQYCKNYGLNEPQARAIASAIQKQYGFSLIQGPPGTGKTKTILALIVSLLDQRSNSTQRRPVHGKLLVCAPSNAAVDEITKRLKDGIMTAHGVRRPNVVRIGVADSVNASVKDRILDRLVEAEMDAAAGNDTTIAKIGARLDSLHNEIRNIQIGLDDVDREITQAGGDMVQMSILRGRRKALAQKLAKAKIALKDAHQDQKNYGQEMEVSRIRARQKVLANADVVCATLSGSGHDMLTTMGMSFGTVIVDEAAQSVEISSLIPLKFDTQKCVLVGDPNQLPPTVMSTMAAKYDYQQSLFMRLEKTVGEEVNLLSIQYRMHPEISSFPSKLFYQSRLQDGPQMDKMSSAVWHALPEFPPYCFFDVYDGQEKMGRGKSIFNAAEANAAVTLVDLLLTKLPTFASKIGVITPYKQQVGQLKAAFQKRFGSNIVDAIDFNTVDGFQGQEKEIIIFSCVRAGNDRGIGFLADMRRMNVGLTRAKFSLFVLGHASSLAKSEYWGELVRDAEQRSLIREVKGKHEDKQFTYAS